MRTVSDDQRRARLAIRQHLAPSAWADDVAIVAGDVAGLHATDPATVLLAARARLRDATPRDVEHALYEARSVVRLLGMRRTMFVVPVDLAAVVQASSTRALLPRERKISVGLLEASGVTEDGECWLADAQEQTLRALAARGQATAVDLTAAVPALREKVGIASDKPYGTTQGMTTRVLFLLAAEGRIVRGRPLGSWTSSLYRWSLINDWLPAGLPLLDPGEASAELVRRWLRAFGPGTYADLKWWTGWPAAQLRRALAAVGPVEVRLDGGWAQRKDGDIAFTLLEDPGSEEAAAIAAGAERLREWIGDVRVTPRFRTPLERALCES